MKKKKLMVIAYLLLMSGFIVQRCHAQTPTLWGMTPGGGQFNLGTIFSYDLNTSNYAIQYNFDSTSGISPYGSLIQARNGYLYGMTIAGGTYNGGTIFSYNTSTGAYCNNYQNRFVFQGHRCATYTLPSQNPHSFPLVHIYTSTKNRKYVYFFIVVRVKVN